MQARTLSPAAIFGYDIRYVIPLFQRPYVWNEEDQWAPLWADVRAVAESLLTAPGGYLGPEVSPHFLGALVLDQPLARAGYIAARYVVDGQQRLTTLQLLLDAAQWVVQQHGSKMDAQALDVLVRNKPEIAQQRQEIFKVWPTDRDQAAFEAAMDDDLKVPPALAGSAIARAHDFFAQEIRWWALDPEVPGDSEARLRALVQSLRDHLKLVVIDLEPGDNAQVIFETLNHRGAPLLAADLIKNFVFQLAEAQGLDVTALYRQYWQDLDGDYWRDKIARGRQYVPRIDIFVNYWLVARFRQEVPADRIFTAFRDQVLKNKLDVPTVLAESWLVRRALCRYTSKDINRTMFDLIGKLDETGPTHAGDVVEDFLAGQAADSRVWPSDEAVREAVRKEPLYSALLRARLRMVLGAWRTIGEPGRARKPAARAT